MAIGLVASDGGGWLLLGSLRFFGGLRVVLLGEFVGSGAGSAEETAFCSTRSFLILAWVMRIVSNIQMFVGGWLSSSASLFDDGRWVDGGIGALGVVCGGRRLGQRHMSMGWLWRWALVLLD